MKVLLCGEKKSVDRMAPKFKSAGADTICVSDPDKLGKVNGTPGQFSFMLNGESRDSEIVVLTGDVKIDPFLQDDTSFTRRLRNHPFDQPIAFFLDLEGQSPSALFTLVLNRAIQAVSAKRDSVVFARDMRTADPGVEGLYLKARQAGVGFIRYRELSVSQKNGTWILQAFGNFPGGGKEENNTIIKTQWALDGTTTGLSGIELFLDKLRIKAGEGADTQGRYWLYPAFTSRKGVYFIDESLIPSEKIDAVVTGIIAAANKENTVVSGDSSFAYVDSVKCAFCYTCFRACPHAALVPDQNAAAMMINQSSCEVCGICVAICPANAISIKSSENDKVVGSEDSSSMTVGAEKGILKIIACENSAFHASLEALNGEPEKYGVGIVSVPCCGSVNSSRIIKELEVYRLVLVAACMEDACQHFDGNNLGCKQTMKLINNMNRLGLDARVQFCHASSSMVGPLKEEINHMLQIGKKEESE